MAYTLPHLPYAYDALEPHIDAKTMEIHHSKHHQTYINNINAGIEGTPWENLTVEQLVTQVNNVPTQLKNNIINNAGGHANHSLFWTVMSPQGGGQPIGKIAVAIEAELGGFDNFKEDFTKAALTRFGSGWAWLTVTPDQKLLVESSANQDSPLMQGHTPVLALDVWEHAYYLKYQNRRPEYISAFFNVVDWQEVNQRYEQAIQ
ncbi:superoxide dismutase [Acinetobacter tandoii]|uniref:Superoxide dismutase n=1 Tax=Acinetobacter tandoii DSM 14970 = CIP 107469 TaxID=1120927 RepID=R9B2J8_9GAMM|nr:superoxide dismutase [Acinetobacter tandoii]EOR06616.1 superoxide dismutase [Mn] [Acinetobacter tandoii DSM 14970 = CIP 107469]